MRYAAGVLAAAIATPVPAASAASAQATRVEAIRAHLFYERTGVLSDDLIANEPALFNVIIGGGDVKEPANAVVIAIVLGGRKDSYDDDTAVTVTVTAKGRDGKIRQLAKRSIKGLLFGAEGRLVKPIFIEDGVCAPMTVTAAAKAGSRSVTIPFMCGE